MQASDFDHLREQLRCMAVERIDDCAAIWKSMPPMPTGLGGAAVREYAKKRDRKMSAIAMQNSIALGLLLALDALGEHIDYLTRDGGTGD